MLNDVGEGSLQRVIYKKKAAWQMHDTHMTTWNIWYLKTLHTLKLTWPLKIGHPKRKLIFQPSIFRGYVSFREGTGKLHQNAVELCLKTTGSIARPRETSVVFLWRQSLDVGLEDAANGAFWSKSRLDKNRLSTWQMESWTLNGLLGQSWLWATVGKPWHFSFIYAVGM